MSNYSRKKAEKKRKEAATLGPKLVKKTKVSVFKIVMLVFLIICVIGLFAGIGIVKGVIDSAPEISAVDVAPSGYATTLYYSDGTEMMQLVASGANRIYVTIDEIPDYVGKAFVAIEDERFYEHNGIDLKGIARAAFVGIKNGFKFSEGASTITQQLIKNNVFEDWVNQTDFLVKLKRKIQEQYLALQLEKNMEKPQILENYINTINLGQNTLGVQAAAQRYFNKDAAELTISESAVLAAITQNPYGNNPIKFPDTNKERRDKVLNNMLKHEYITQAEYDEAMADDVYSRIATVNEKQDDGSIYTYFVDAMIGQVMDSLMEEKGYSETQAYNLLYRGGLKIYTTQDKEIQQICDEEYADDDNFPSDSRVTISYRLTLTHVDGATENYSENTMRKYFKENLNEECPKIFSSRDEANSYIERYKANIVAETDTVVENITYIPQPQSSFVIMDPYSGEVLAIVGGRGEKNASLTLNRATDTTRQPGSCFKVLAAFTAALDHEGKTLATTYDDAPYKYSNGRPVNNYDFIYRGPTTIRSAITYSRNIVTVKCLTDITPELGYEYLLKYGFTTLCESDIVQALALGGITYGITNLEMTAAYAAIANGGVYTKPMFFTRITDANGKEIIGNAPVTSRVMKETTAFLLTDAMEDVVTKGTGTAARLSDMPVAGKTGTTSDEYDLWFSGYTPYYCASVWMGYDENTSLNTGRAHSVLWKKIMTRIHETKGLEYKKFEKPDGITSATVCSKTGLIATDGCPEKYTEYFEKGTISWKKCEECAGEATPAPSVTPNATKKPDSNNDKDKATEKPSETKAPETTDAPAEVTEAPIASETEAPVQAQALSAE